MPIPPLTSLGFLPPGIHDANMTEIESRYGQFASTDRRVVLFRKLSEYIAELSQWGHVEEMLIDGSFVSAKDSPGDIDLILVYSKDFDRGSDVSPSEYNCLKQARVKRLYGFDAAAVIPNSDAHHRWIKYFTRDSRMPDIEKGILRVFI